MIRSLQAQIAGCAILVAGLAASHALAGEPRLLRPGQYHGHEVTAVPGERWLALVRGAGGRDRLVPVTLQVDTVPDMDEEEGTATGKLVVRHRNQAQVPRTYRGYYTDGAFGGVGDDGIPNLIWAGDLDGDGALDLLIDLSDHYNMLRPTLYMSRKRGGRTLLEPVAAHESVGC
jgi:hypothetical protein